MTFAFFSQRLTFSCRSCETGWMGFTIKAAITHSLLRAFACCWSAQRSRHRTKAMWSGDGQMVDLRLFFVVSFSLSREYIRRAIENISLQFYQSVVAYPKDWATKRNGIYNGCVEFFQSYGINSAVWDIGWYRYAARTRVIQDQQKHFFSSIFSKIVFESNDWLISPMGRKFICKRRQ